MKYFNNEQGAALLIAMVIMIVCSFMGTATLMTTTIEEKISGNQRTSRIAFYAADAGIEKGRVALNDLMNTDSDNWNKLLAGTALSTGDSNLNTYIATTPGGSAVGCRASFSLEVSNDGDTDSNTIMLTSTGSGPNNAKSKIEAILLYNQGDYYGYAQEHYDAAGTSNADSETGGVDFSSKLW